MTDALDMLETLACHAGQEQQRVLSEILTVNAGAEYVQGLGLSVHPGCTDLQTFKWVAPIITYDDIKPLIQRIVDGDQSPILTTHPISLLFLSSGTSSGEPKFLPTHDDDMQRRDSALFCLAFPLLARAAKEAGLFEENATRMLNFLFVKPEFRTPGGLPVRTLITNLCKSEAFRTHAPSAYTSPVEVFLCEDVLQSMYCQLLCGLIQRSEVGCVGAIFASGLLRVMHFLERWWGELVRDIRGGTLSNDVVSDLTVRRTVEALIATMGGPNPALAEELEAEFKRLPTWQGIIRRLWPQAKFVSAVVTGSMSQYVSMLDFYTGGLPCASLGYSSSECYLGVNLAPYCPLSDISYMLLPNMAYFEFLPCPAIDESRYMHSTIIQNDQMQSTTETTSSSLIDLVDVKLGEAYELVVTTYAGLYRYRMGDVLRVTGFHKEAPLFQFVRRANVLLSIDADKTDEETLQKAVEAATSAHLDAVGWCLVDYTSYADISTSPGHYVLFWEVRRDGKMVVPEDEDAVQLDLPTVEACCLAMEENLGIYYKWSREWEKSIGPLEIRVVKEGTFNAIMEVLCEQQGPMKGSSISQYKMRRCINKQLHAPTLDLLNSRVSLFALGPQCPSFASLP